MGKTWIIVIAFLVVGGFIIKGAYNLNLESQEDRKTFIGKFAAWVLHLGGNVKDLTGQAIEQDWLPDSNNTNKSLTYVIYER
ncbi:MAG: hypothetical protein ABH879_05605 [archaeon]